MYKCNCQSKTKSYYTDKKGFDSTYDYEHLRVGKDAFKNVPTDSEGVCKLCGHYAIWYGKVRKAERLHTKFTDYYWFGNL